ncbi:MAG: carboxypeptidase regulatory-like domain-containing protein [Bacteroidales bacterium]|nr:carboxypeptidase regulatory-like domain-containing protein [Bacteroidales bacterium]
MKKAIILLLSSFLLLVACKTPASSEHTGFYKQTGHVVDAETGIPLPGATVTNFRESVQTDKEGGYTISYHTYDSDLRVFVSHPGYVTDTFGCAPMLVRLHPMPKDTSDTKQR